ncbi:oxygenase MpaB family protein [Murinocardiopsis flavida]|uniref:oxygenase MpaB family protein n=1 Tax=Murinocardiopsis flavida TaxID=645275 RepID=UPI001FE6FBE0|nr:oxygenase MpaB family protein [Murinocardiopsis flavida]
MSTEPASPPSALQRVTREAAVLGGAGYALALQVSHPSVGRGVAEHSDYADRPLDRLRGTLTFVYGQVFGTPDEAERIGRIVRAMHTTVNGPGYDALDPDLQLWVAATLYDGGVRLYELVVGPLTDADKDAAYDDAAVFATALGCPAERWPADRAAFEEYWAATIAAMRPDATARTIIRNLSRPASLPLRPLMRLQMFLTAGLLPAHLRAPLGLSWDALRQRRFDRLLAAVRTVYPHLPAGVRQLPMRLVMRDMRRRAGRGRLYHRRRPGRPTNSNGPSRRDRPGSPDQPSPPDHPDQSTHPRSTRRARRRGA